MMSEHATHTQRMSDTSSHLRTNFNQTKEEVVSSLSDYAFHVDRESGARANV